MAESTVESNRDALSAVLARPDVQDSLVAALENLPKLMEQYAAISRVTEFATTVLQDKASMNALMDGVKEQLPVLELNRETVEAAANLLGKLPKLVKYAAMAENLIDMVESVLTDKESMQYLLDGFREELPSVTLDRETLEASVVLVSKLPKLVGYVTMAEQLLDMAQSVLGDKESLAYLTDGAREWTEPVVGKLSDARSLWDEAKVRAQGDRTPVNVFALTKLLKEPQAQKAVRMLKAILSVMQERSASK